MTCCNKFGIIYLFNHVPVLLLSILIQCIILYVYFCLYFLHCIWLGCIRSCIKDLSHGFLANKWLVHNWFMSLGNPLEVVVHYLLIEGMIGLSYQDEFYVVSILVYMATYWTRPTVSHDLKLSSSHDLTKLLHFVVSQPWENIEFMLKLAVTLTYGWDRKLIIYSLWIGLLWMETGSNRYSR